VGSWATYFYAYYYDHPSYQPILRTTDIDFLVPHARSRITLIDLNHALEQLGFYPSNDPITDTIVYDKADFTIEFLVPELGAGKDKSVEIKELNVSAQPLRYLTMLSENVMLVQYYDYKVKVPDPVAYVFHKLLVSPRRKKEEESLKDYQSASELAQFLKGKGMIENIQGFFKLSPKGWKRTILETLGKYKDTDLIKDLHAP